jgi:hypothetical protein
MCCSSWIETCEGGAAKRLPLQDREPYLDLVEPGRACRREMKLHIRMGLAAATPLAVAMTMASPSTMRIIDQTPPTIPGSPYPCADHRFRVALLLQLTLSDLVIGQ